MLLLDKGDYEAAGPVLREAVEVGRKALRPEHPYLTSALSGQARLMSVKGDHKTAEQMLRNTLEIQKRTLPAGHPAITDSQTALGACLTAQRRFDEAEPPLLESYSTLSSKRGAHYWRTKRTLSRLVALYEAWGKRDKAARYRSMQQVDH